MLVCVCVSGKDGPGTNCFWPWGAVPCPRKQRRGTELLYGGLNKDTREESEEVFGAS